MNYEKEELKKDVASIKKELARLGANVSSRYILMYLECQKKGDFLPMAKTNLYIKRSVTYCCMVQAVAYARQEETK